MISDCSQVLRRVYQRERTPAAKRNKEQKPDKRIFHPHSRSLGAVFSTKLVSDRTFPKRCRRVAVQCFEMRLFVRENDLSQRRTLYPRFVASQRVRRQYQTTGQKGLLGYREDQTRLQVATAAPVLRVPLACQRPLSPVRQDAQSNP